MKAKEKQQQHGVVLKLPNIEKYQEELEQQVIARKGKLDAFLKSQIRITAGFWRKLDMFSAAMEKTDILMPKMGSTGQVNYIVNPMWAQYDSMHRTLLAHMKALGLNYDIAPEKVSESDVVNNDDPLTKMLSE